MLLCINSADSTTIILLKANIEILFGFRGLEFQLEAFALEVVVVLLVEAVFDGGAGAVAGGAVVYFFKDAKVLHLAGEVAAVELDFQDGLVEVLELGEGEDLREEVETDRSEVDVLLEAGESVAEDLVVVEGEGGDIGQGEPIGLVSIGIGLNLGKLDKGVVRDGDHALARVAVNVAVGAGFLEVFGRYFEPGFLFQLA